MSTEYTHQGKVPLPPPEAKVDTTACGYCVVSNGVYSRTGVHENELAATPASTRKRSSK